MQACSIFLFKTGSGRFPKIKWLTTIPSESRSFNKSHKLICFYLNRRQNGHCFMTTMRPFPFPLFVKHMKWLHFLRLKCRLWCGSSKICFGHSESSKQDKTCEKNILWCTNWVNISFFVHVCTITGNNVCSNVRKQTNRVDRVKL